MIPENILVPTSKEVLQNKSTVMTLCQGTWVLPESVTNNQSWNNLSNTINNVVLNYNPKYKNYPWTYIDETNDQISE